jgi:hypothetical protein
MIWCMSVISDFTNCRINANKRLKNARQKLDQSVKDFMHYIENLKRDFPYQTDNSVKGYQIFNALRPELHTEMVREFKDNITRDAVVSTATRHKKLLKKVRSRANLRQRSFLLDLLCRARVPPRKRLKLALPIHFLFLNGLRASAISVKRKGIKPLTAIKEKPKRNRQASLRN